jgi:hypothetical protein
MQLGGRAGLCCAYGAACVADGAPEGYGFVGACAQTDAATARAAAKAVVLKRWFMESTSR